VIALNVQQNEVCLVGFVDRVSQLTAAPVFEAVNLAT
jgi:hypothetical protein